MEETIKGIKRQFRLRMNGPIAASMREKGVCYKVNFGLTYPQIREIALRLQPDVRLAEALWKEDVRESKILATLLFPAERMYREEAERWLTAIPYPEIADYAVMNLFSRLPFAPDFMVECVKSDRPLFRYTGFMLAGRLWSRGATLLPEQQKLWLAALCDTCRKESGFMVLAAVNSLERLLASDETITSEVRKLAGENEIIRHVLDRFEKSEE